MNLENTEMEAVVLGSILANPEILYSVMDLISKDCFAEELHSSIYDCIQDLLGKGEKISPLRLINKYTETLGEDNVNYIKVLASKAAPLTLRTNVKHLVDLAHRRELIHTCQATLSKAHNFDKTGLELAGELTTQVTKIISKSTSDETTIIQAATGIYDEMRSPEPEYRAKTGLKMLDVATNGGFHRSRVYAFMAAAKIGKTMLATTISQNLNANGHKHLFVAAEMGSRELTQRILAQRCGISTNTLSERENPIRIEIVAKSISELKNNIIFADEPGIEFESLKLLVERHVYKNKIEGFILDYYQLVGGQQKGETQAQHLENIANWVHRVCKKHNIWCILLVQTNDESKVLGSRGLNRACDQGYLIERPLDDKGDPFGRVAWLKQRFSRYTKIYNLGNESDPTLAIHENGTHFEEIMSYK